MSREASAAGVRSLRIVTWNVLHRVHGMNYADPALHGWTDEAARIESIVRFVEGLDVEAIALQEVSGDLLERLRALRCFEVFVHGYARVPAYRVADATPLRDRSEHLVTLVRSSGARERVARSFAGDAGKGFLVVELASGAWLANTHVSFGEHRDSQCADLATVVAAAPRVVVAGDFNAPHAACAKALGARFDTNGTAASLPTRPQSSETIDHVFVAGAELRRLAVLDGGRSSDHEPVLAEVAWEGAEPSATRGEEAQP